MELSRQEYPALLTSVLPTQAVNVLNDRVAYIGKVNADVANWLAERRRIEDAYVLGLKKLARLGASSGNLGVFQAPWQGLVNSVEALASSHEAYAKRIDVDVEKPLRDFTNKNREMQNISTMKGNLASLAKDFDEAQKKSDKLQGKGAKADTSKLSSALSGVQEAGAAWESQAPYVFESLQALDESRVNHMRDVLTQLQTHEVDLLERSRAAATSTLELILTVDTTEEISAFVARNAEGGPSLQSRPATASQQGPSRSVTAAFGSLAPPAVDDEPETPVAPPKKKRSQPQPRGAGSLTSAFASLAPPDLEDREEDSSPVRAPKTPSASQPPPTPAKKSTFGGLRRLGTVMGRKNKDPASPKPEKPQPPERKSKGSRNPLRRNSTLSGMDRLPSPNASAIELGDSSARQVTNDAPALSRATSVEQSESRPVTQPETNGDAGSALNGESLTNGIVAQSTLSQPRQIRPPSTILEEGAPSALDEITRAQQEANAANEESGQHLKVDIRNNPISEEDTAAQSAAFSNVANALRAQAAPPARKQGTVRGRRDVRNTIFVPSGVTPESIMTPPDAATFPSPLLGNRPSTDEKPADTQSVRSGHSLTSLGASNAHRHAELTQAGLNASIIETINTSFSEGQVTKALVVGEMALSYNGQASASKETIRLDNFPALLKVAQNPVFVQPIAGKNGEYDIDLQAISKPQIGFKYQVHLDDGAQAVQSPVILHPQWKVEPHQTSVMINYKWNAALDPHIESLTLSNVIVLVQLEDKKVTSCWSKPSTGIWSAERNMIYWKLGQIVLKKDAPQERLLARFTAQEEIKAGTVEARWEINNEHAYGVGSNLGVSVRSEDAEKREQTPDPFSDDGTADSASGYKPIHVVRKLINGKYLAN